MSTMPRYHIHLPVFLPVGPIDHKTGENTFLRIEGPTELEYNGEPSLLWSPLNQAAVEAQVQLMDKIIALKTDALKFIKADDRNLPERHREIVRLEKMRAAIKPTTAPVQQVVAEPDTMSAIQKTIPGTQQQPQQGQKNGNVRR
jgi:hypothetical protein